MRLVLWGRRLPTRVCPRSGAATCKVIKQDSFTLPVSRGFQVQLHFSFSAKILLQNNLFVVCDSQHLESLSSISHSVSTTSRSELNHRKKHHKGKLTVLPLVLKYLIIITQHTIYRSNTTLFFQQKRHGQDLQLTASSGHLTNKSGWSSNCSVICQAPTNTSPKHRSLSILLVKRLLTKNTDQTEQQTRGRQSSLPCDHRKLEVSGLPCDQRDGN